MGSQSPTLVRCERCKAVISSSVAADLIRDGAACGVCGGTMVLCDSHLRSRTPDAMPTSPERRLLGVLRTAEGRPVGLHALAEAGIDDPATTIYELERAGHRIERAYSEATAGRRRLLGYRLRGGPVPQANASQPSSSR